MRFLKISLFILVAFGGAGVVSHVAAEPCQKLYRNVEAFINGDGVAQGDLDMNGNDIIIDADGDSKLDLGTDDEFAIDLGGTPDYLKLTTSDLTLTVPLGLPDGTAAAPSLYGVNYPTTGLYYDSNLLKFTVDGQIRYNVSTTAMAMQGIDINLNGNALKDSAAKVTIGADAASTHALGVNDTHVTGKFEVDLAAYFDGTTQFAGVATFIDNYALKFGSGADSQFVWATGQTVDTLLLGTSSDSNAFVLVESGDLGFDFSHAQQTNPTLFGHSANQSTTEWWSNTHDQTDRVYGVGSGDHKFNDDGGKGVATFIKTTTESVTFPGGGAASQTTTGSILANGAFVTGVTYRVTNTGTTCAGFDIGISGGDTDLYGADIAVAAGTTGTNADATASFANPIGVNGAGAQEIIVTGTDGAGTPANCVDMVVAITVHSLDATAATSN